MIKVLTKDITDKIAAGEVIERPVSIVKELLENSIDAGAKKIIIEIKKGGTKYIRVTDDGCGIPHADVKTAFLRHATSKIDAVSDLDQLSTLGFRGEALASIAACSKLELITKAKGEETAIKLEIEGGDIVDEGKIGAPDGTSLIVKDVFFNMPARRKFLSSQQAESGRITSLVTRMALCYPDIKFRMISNDNILFQTPGTGSRMDAISTIFGPTHAGSLLHTSGDDDGIKIDGYLSMPSENKANRSGQIFFVNGRNIDSDVMEKGIDRAYKERLFSGRYPICYLFLDLDPAKIDVNIHPNKKQVRFDDPETIASFITASCKKALSTPDSLPLVKSKETPYIADPAKPINNARSHIPKTTTYGVERVDKQVDVKELLSTLREENKNAVSEIETASVDVQRDTFKFEELEYVGAIFDTYLLLENEDEFFMIDQHAAHERIYYESFKRSLAAEEDMTQQIMTPLTIDVKRDNDSWAKPLVALGYDIEEFGSWTYIVRGIPVMFDITQAESFIYDYIDTLDELEQVDDSQVNDMIAKRACKAAVKSGDALSGPEVRSLLAELDFCDDPWSCPHGRPVAIRMTLAEIEKRFKRR